MKSIDEILGFWFDKVGPRGWYLGGDELDQRIRDFALLTYEKVAGGAADFWMGNPEGALATIIVLDQLPRNMFRDTERAFATDHYARAAACVAIEKGWDMKIDESQRSFFYLPLMHSENLSDQERCVRKFLTNMSKLGASNLTHARAHREVIRRYGRFPYRNEVLNRISTEAEIAFMENNLYAEFIKVIEAGGSPDSVPGQNKEVSKAGLEN